MNTVHAYQLKIYASLPRLMLVAGLCWCRAAPCGDPQVSKGIIYATRSGQDLKLDLSVPEGPGPFPLIVFIHGGGWQGGAREDVLPAVLDAARRGYAAAAVSYRFSTRATWPAQLDDVESAVRWLRANAGQHRIDPTRVAAAGWSAGGHLSLMLGVTPRTLSLDDAGVDAVVNYFGPTDMTTDVFNDFVDKLLSDLAGGSREEKALAFKDFSPVTHITRGSAPVLTFQGTADPLVPGEQARVLHRALEAAGVPNRLEILEGRAHGWGGDDLKRTTEQSFEFLDSYLKGSSLPSVVAEDFGSGLDRWEPTEIDAWKVELKQGRATYVLGKPTQAYEPKVRSPLHYSLLRNADLSDFVLDVRAQSTAKDYGHRDLCFFFGWQDAQHFYYVHIAKAADPHAHSVFLVDGKDRVSIAKDRTAGYNWDDAWHRVRIRREAATGEIEVFIDDLTKPVMTAVDRTFLHGRVGLGSFDDTGNFAELRLRGKP